MSGRGITNAEFIGDESAQRLLRRAQQVSAVSKRINSVGPGFRSVRNEEFGDDARYETKQTRAPETKTGGAKRVSFASQFS
jgi:hypothetical protein